MYKYFKIFSLILIITLMLPLNLFSQERSKGPKLNLKKEIKTENVQTSPKPWNQVCPVMGEEVDPNVKTVTYKGKVYGFCCKKCIKKFQANPEKYIKNLSEDGTKFLEEK